MKETERNLALLIDAENVSSKYIKDIIDELAKYGTPTYKRIYGNFTDSTLRGWKDVLLVYSITPMQQFSYTSGKNASDSSLIIDAMDILYSGNVDGFCLVSSDSDFTRLAARLREAGKFVIGMGEKKTPAAFINACEKFVFLEIFDKVKSTAMKSSFNRSNQKPEKRNSNTVNGKQTKQSDVKKPRNKDTKPVAKDVKKPVEEEKVVEAVEEQVVSTQPEQTTSEQATSMDIATAIEALYPIIEEKEDSNKAYDLLIEQLYTAINDASDDEGWANLADVGNLISKRVPSFDSRNYGYKKLADMLADIDGIEIRKEKSAINPNTYIVYVRIKK